MATKSPTTSVKSREMIGGDQFSQRREVFDKHDTVFLPLPSPTGLSPVYKEVEPIITSNHGITTSNFKRNSPGYSSMRETRSEGRTYEFRPRKYSDNFTSDLNQSDDVDYRQSMIDRSRRLSKLRREFLNSNLHDPSQSPLSRTGVRASMPTNSVTATRYKFENLSVYKFPFAEPYSTPTPVRRVIVDLGSPSDDGTDVKKDEDPENKPKHQSLPNDTPGSPKVDHQKLFEDLVKRYSPQRKPIDWKLPPTKPKVIGSVPKSVSASSATDSLSSVQKEVDQFLKAEKDDVFEDKTTNDKLDNNDNQITDKKIEDIKPNVEILHNGTNNDEKNETDSKNSLTEQEENDYVPELSSFKRQLSRESNKKPLDKMIDLTIPDLIQKMTVEGEHNKTNKDGKKVKRKRSFLDKLLGRNKGVKIEK